MSVATARASVFRVVVATSLVALGAAAMAGRAMAQGITTSGIRGMVSDEAGQPVVGATVILTGRFTGQRFQGHTQTNGRYYLTNIPVGPYVVESRAIGYRPARNEGIVLALGQVTEVDLRMQASTVELAAITTVAAQRALDPMSQDRTGASSLVTEEMVRNLPSLNRNFTDFIAAVPQVIGDIGSGGPSVAGGNNRFNNLQIDGSVNNDLFGLAGSGAPGGQSNARPISTEAIREFQVLIAPFDVRQGGFTGGLVNAVTRSGTNDFHASVFGYYQGTSFLGSSLVGADSAGGVVTDFNQSQYGFTVAGPIIRDRLHFFATWEQQKRSAPFSGVSIGTDTTAGRDSVGIGIRYPTALRIEQIVRDSLGVDPGTPLAPTIQTPNMNFFGKLSWQPSPNNTFELSYNHVDGTFDNLTHSSTATGFRDGYQLGGAGYQQANRTNTFRAIWTRPIGGRLNNELIGAYQTINDKRALASTLPLIFVGGDRAFAGITPVANVAIGAERFSHANSLDQTIYELTDNLTWSLNSQHTITLGTHNEFFKFHNVFWPAKLGVWSFRDTTALLTRTPFRYEVNLPGANGIGPIADFSVNQIGFYAQDNWTPSSRLTVNFGIRYDLPKMDRPNYNQQLDTATITNGPNAGQPMGINTSTSFPASNALWSPRVGFNYDVHGNNDFMIRGGVGVFSGRPPYVWVSNAFVNTGLEQVTLICDNALSGAAAYLDTVPAFSPANIATPPATCQGGLSASAAASSIVYFDPSFRLPQNLRFALGVDHRLPWNMTGTMDLVYTQWLNAIYLTDVNLVAGGRMTGEGNRQLYGTLSTSSSTANPVRLTSQFRDVIQQSNSNQDYSYQATFQVQKRFSDGLEFNAGYTYARTYDLMSLTSSISNSNLRFAVLDGTLDNRNLRPSSFDVPHTVKVSVTGNLPLGMRGTLFYQGRSGTPYTYVTSNDINGDGLGGNDEVYVPLNAQDIQLCPASGSCVSTSQDAASYAKLDAYINGEVCLRDNRGRILARNSCRNPWQSMVNGTLSRSFHTVGGQSFEVSAQIFNLMAFLGIGGKVQVTSFFENVNLLSYSRYNSAAGRGVYFLNLPIFERVDPVLSRWRILLGGKYNY